MPDPFAIFDRNDECWCQSGRKYKRCHGWSTAHAPGAALPPDPADGLYVSPDVVVPRPVIDSMIAQLKGEPIHMPSPDPVQRAQRVPELTTRLAALAARRPSVSLPELGRLRFELLDQMGLSEKQTVASRLAGFSADDIEALSYGVIDLAKSTLDRLLEQASGDEHEVILWAEPHDLIRLVGQTLLVADRYLARDPLMSALLRGAPARELGAPLGKLLELRPLVEAGLVVLVPDELGTVLTNDAVVAATERDLKRRELTDWVMGELSVDGPSARSVAFVSARDDLQRGPGMFYLHADIDASKLDETGLVGFHALHAYDASFDYRPWLAQCRRQSAAKLIQELNRELAIAEVFGGSFVTRAPFRARLLSRRGEDVGGPAATVWADVPWLPDVAAKDMVAISRNDETVEALRAEVRRAFRFVEADRAHEAAVGLVADLERASEVLRRQIGRERAWTLAVPAGAAVGSMAIAATGGIAAAAGAAVSAFGLAQYVAAAKARRANPAFAFVMAARRARGKGHGRRAADQAVGARR